MRLKFMPFSCTYVRLPPILACIVSVYSSERTAREQSWIQWHDDITVRNRLSGYMSLKCVRNCSLE
jgi:hypothetical protein